ncbi:MAG: hypothetical protein CNE91_00165 [SAR116 cluster bacterium MED-G04]|nr:MAG: hypothetical protein CNE91_00165 [SAR116 cluster bacterium MED-G04]
MASMMADQAVPAPPVKKGYIRGGGCVSANYNASYNANYNDSLDDSHNDDIVICRPDHGSLD